MSKICINPGHGAGGDYGACANGRREADDVLRIGLALRDQLRGRGVEVVMTREQETGPRIEDCIAMANSADCDYFLSLHENAGGGTGGEAWVYHAAIDETQRAARKLLDAYLAATGLKNRGVKLGAPGYEDFAVCRDTKMPACLLEMGFVDNVEDMAANDANIDAIARNLADALCEIVGAPAQSAPAVPDYPEPSRLIKQGCTGEDVKWVQRKLCEAGYSVGSAGIDGICGTQTVNAIKQAQRDNGLAVDGIVGPNTRAALKGQNPFDAPGTLLRSGDTGEGVKWVQWALKRRGYEIGTAGIDGKYGPATRAAVERFQRDNGLAVDGIVGPNTRGKLEG